MTVDTLPITITSALDCTGQSPVQTVPACLVQIRAHHHIDVHTDINNSKVIVIVIVIAHLYSALGKC